MTKQTGVELLAPAGSLQSFFAALEYGADAVFCGLQSFSARAKAKNFSLDELEQMVGHAHKLDKKVYVAFNTLIQDAELEQLVEVLAIVEGIGVDALIVQDLGLYRLAHIHFPAIPLHASTQMVVHNLAGVRVLEGLGFERVVLARELSLAEISHISKNSHLEIEHFIHGALCYSMSGHCLFSSYIDGKSGNRGRCAQPCRRRYHQGETSGFYFSTSDFSAIELIPDLVAAGVMSLKIEGRMKSAEYVAAVVAAYRTVLDAAKGEEQKAIAQAQKHLEGAMGRKSSTGFLPGRGGGDIVLPQIKGGLGRIAGKVERVQGGQISFRSSETIHVGDRLRIQPTNDRGGQGFTVRRLLLGQKGSKVAGKGSFVTIPLPPLEKSSRKFRVGLGDEIFKVGMGKSFTLSEEACRRKLKVAPKQAHEVVLRITCVEESATLTVFATVAGIEYQKSYGVEMIPAKRTPLNHETLLKVFSHTGYPLLSCGTLQESELPPVVIKPSRLKAIRCDFYGELEECVLSIQHKAERVRQRSIIAAIMAPEREEASTSEPEFAQVYVVSDSLVDLESVTEAPDILFIFPVDKEFLEGVRLQTFSETECGQIIWDLPSVCFDSDWLWLVGAVETLRSLGFLAFRLNNISQFDLFQFTTGLHLLAGPWLYTLNGQTHHFLAERGCEKMCLSIEDDKENIIQLLQRGLSEQLLITLYGRVDLFTSRITGIAERGEINLRNDQGGQVHLRQSEGLTLTMADKAFSLLGSCGELKRAGGQNFILDLRGLGFGSTTGKNIMDAFLSDRPLEGTVTLNFKRGLL
jgi:putative protease